MKRSSVALFLAVAFLAAGSVSAQSQTQPAEKPPESSGEPDHIKVQHILIGFEGSLRGKSVTRTKEEAKKLAYEVLEKAKAGEDFGSLVKQYTDDSYPGIYAMANNGVKPNQGEYPRGRMVAAFGDTGFPLKVGGIGIADHDPKKSPFGWHIVKRIE